MWCGMLGLPMARGRRIQCAAGMIVMFGGLGRQGRCLWVLYRVVAVWRSLSLRRTLATQGAAEAGARLDAQSWWRTE